jgi:membrane associated rhomboid family serine protease
MYDYLQYAPVASFFFLITLVTSLYAFFADTTLFDRFILNPWRIKRKGEYYRLLTAGLIHADFFHLLFNLLTFYFFAKMLESYYLGHWQFGLVYVLSQVVSNAYPAWRHRDEADYRALGASGAVSGMLFSFILFNPMARLGVFFIIPMPAWLFALLFVAISFAFARRGDSTIGHEAHLAGALTGFFLTLAIHPMLLPRLIALLGTYFA